MNSYLDKVKNIIKRRPTKEIPGNLNQLKQKIDELNRNIKSQTHKSCIAFYKEARDLLSRNLSNEERKDVNRAIFLTTQLLEATPGPKFDDALSQHKSHAAYLRENQKKNKTLDTLGTIMIILAALLVITAMIAWYILAPPPFGMRSLMSLPGAAVRARYIATSCARSASKLTGPIVGALFGGSALMFFGSWGMGALADRKSGLVRKFEGISTAAENEEARFTLNPNRNHLGVDELPFTL